MRRLLPVLGAPQLSAACASCGECCKSYPGILSPEDVGAPDRDLMRVRVAELLRLRKYAIDWWEGDPRLAREAPAGADGIEWSGSCANFLRAAMVSGHGDVFHPGWGGRPGAECVHLGEAGCTLEHDARPYNCRALVPMRIPENACLTPAREDGKRIGKLDFALAWLPYSQLLTEVGLAVEEEREAAPSARTS